MPKYSRKMMKELTKYIEFLNISLKMNKELIILFFNNFLLLFDFILMLIN